MRTFEQYELIAFESKKLLFNAYIKESMLEKEYKSKGGIDGGTELYKWRKSQKEKLNEQFKGNNLRSLFLESWNKGDFPSCDAYINRFIL